MEGIDLVDSAAEKEENELFETNIRDLVASLVSIDLNKLLVFIRDLNAMQKSAKVAQRLLNYVVRTIPIDDFAEIAKKFRIPEKKAKVEEDVKGKDKKKKLPKKKMHMEESRIPDSSDKSDFEKLMEILTSYSKRHAERMDRFIKKSYYLDFVLRKIDLLSEQAATESQ